MSDGINEANWVEVVAGRMLELEVMLQGDLPVFCPLDPGLEGIIRRVIQAFQQSSDGHTPQRLELVRGSGSVLIEFTDHWYVTFCEQRNGRPVQDRSDGPTSICPHGERWDGAIWQCDIDAFRDRHSLPGWRQWDRATWDLFHREQHL